MGVPHFGLFLIKGTSLFGMYSRRLVLKQACQYVSYTECINVVSPKSPELESIVNAGALAVQVSIRYSV